MSDEALRARRHNLSKARLRSDRESLVMKLLIWQSCFDGGPRLSQRALAGQLGVRHSYVWKVQKQAGNGLEALTKEARRVTLADLERAREFTKKLGEQEPNLLAPARGRRLHGGEPRGGQGRLAGAMTADEIIAEQQRFAEEWKRKNPTHHDTRRRIRISILH
jgi:hypothetical protein